MPSYRWMVSLALLIALILGACQPVPPLAPGGEPAPSAAAPDDATTDTSTPEVFVQGALLPGIVDIATGPDGNLYGAVEHSDAIVVVDPATGEIVKQIPAGEDTPEALTVGPDGSVYWSSFYSLNVCRMTPAGEKTCQAMPTDVWGLAFSPDGRLFVATEAHVAALYELDPLLVEEPRLVKDMGTLMSHFRFGPDGMLYTPLMGDGTIVRIDVDVEPVTVETVAEGLIMPWAVAFDSTGQLYAATSLDAEHNALFRIDLETGAGEQLGVVPAGYHTLAIGPDDRIFLAHYDEGAIYEYLPTGEMRPLTAPGMIGPGGLAVLKRPDGGESLLVAGWKTLHEFDTASGEQRNAWRSAWFPDMISPPRTVTADGANLLVSGWEDQWGGNLVQVWDPVAGKSVTAMDNFVRPANVIRFQGDLVVVEMVSDTAWRIQRTDGDDVASLHTLGGDALKQPLGLAASDDALWVADYATGSVYQLVADGAELTEPALVATGLDRPEGMALAADGRLLVAETGAGRLLAIDPATGEIAVIAEGLGFMRENPTSVGPVQLAPYWVFSGVAVDAAGNIYVAADEANAIYRIPATATAVPATGLDDATVAEIDTLVEEMMDRNTLPGFALGVLKDGELVYAKGFGVTSLDGGDPVTPQTVFQWAETSMAPTAMAVLQLVDQGKLSLDAPVTDYLPYFQLKDERYEDITVGQLLMHTSGIPDSGDRMADWENFMPEYDSGATERWVRNDLAEQGLLFAPGSGFEFSDLGYALLGVVVAAASGQTYEAYMSENLFEPLSMDQSTFLLEEVDKTQLAAPHTVKAAGEVVVSKAIPYHRPFAASNNLFTSIEDMAKLVQASLNGGILDGQRILPESAVDQMWTAKSPTPFAGYPFGRVHPARMMIDWGYGWFLGDMDGHLVPNTTAGERGFHAQMLLAPDANLAVFAVGNSSVGDEYYAADTTTDVMGMLLEK